MRLHIFYFSVVFIYMSMKRIPIFPENSFACRAIFGAMLFTVTQSIFCITWIAISRYLVTAKPVNFRKYLNFKWGLVWLVSSISLTAFMGFIAPVIGFWGKFTYMDKIGVCVMGFRFMDGASAATYGLAYTGVCFILPTSIILFCYFRVFFIIRTNANRIQTTKLESNHRKVDTKLNVTMFAIFIVYAIAYSPYALIHLLSFFSIIELTPSMVYYSIIISCGNSVLDPYIIIFRSDKLRQWWKKGSLSSLNTMTLRSKRVSFISDGNNEFTNTIQSATKSTNQLQSFDLLTPIGH